MHRFFIPQDKIKDQVAVISGPEAKHCFRVLRLRRNDRVMVLDGEGQVYSGVIEQIGSGQGKIRVEECVRKTRSLPKVILAAAITKSPKFEEIIDVATQLGVDTIVPLRTQRVVVKASSAENQSRLLRWRRIAESAAKQCANPFLPRIEPAQDFEPALGLIKSVETALIFSLHQEKNKPLPEVLKEKKRGSVIVFIGPEGDFTLAELELAQRSGALPVSLGEYVLRCETAVNAVLSILNYEWSN